MHPTDDLSNRPVIRPALEEFDLLGGAPVEPAHPLGWPNTDPSHRIIRVEPGEYRCWFCDCRPRGKVASLPCEFAPVGWRTRESA